VKVTSGTYSTANRYGCIPPLRDVPAVDVMAALAPDGSLVAMLVHRCASAGPVTLTLELRDFRAAPEAEVVTLAGEAWHAQNTDAEPTRIMPRTAQARVEDGCKVALAPYSLTRIVLRKG
jgi:alpha-N-arabinofuranosidase